MTEAIFREYYYGPRLLTTTTIPDGQVGTASTTVHPHKYVYHYKPKSVSGLKFVGTNFRRPQGWTMYWKYADVRYTGVITYRHGGNTTVRLAGSLSIGHGVPSVSFPEKIVAKAELEALLKLKDEKVNVGVSLGERKEVAGMFRDNLLRVANAYRSARKGDFKRASRQLGLTWKDVPNKWLELQYGWKPLLSDIHTAVEALNAKDREDPTRTWLHVIGKASDTQRSKIDGGTAYSGVLTRSHDQHRFEAKVRFDYKPKENMGLQRSLMQWGISNPAQIAWELIPFSFVVDWAIPIGDYISAFGAADTFEFLCGSQSRFTTSTRESHLITTSSAISASGTARAEQKLFNRYVYGSFPRPNARALLASSHPSQQTIATRVANALSILSNAVK